MFILLFIDPNEEALYKQYSEFIGPMDGDSKSPNLTGMLWSAVVLSF